ncbi:MAG: cytochrome P450 [Gemmatimonas sp.]|jgi:cytochrome P450|uniref:cytochrome P450 n=1 Tax=Gemmatimonas sp. TaxID=1962908 RepID=UPI00391F6AA8|nr:cytochrome P450 [Gemmatimonadota bacterium]
MTARCPVSHVATEPSNAGLRVVRRSALRTGLAIFGDPFRALETLPAHGDVIVTSLFGQPTVLLAHPTPVAEMLREGRGTWIKDRLSRRTADVFGRGLLLSEGEEWRRQRRLLNPGFANARFDAYAHTMRARTAAAMAKWPVHGTLDAAAEMARLTLDVAVRTLFGADIADRDAHRVAEAFAAVSDFVASPIGMLPIDVPRWLPLPVVRRHRRAIAELDAVVGALIRARRGSNAPGEDLLAMLLAARDETGGLSDAEVRDQAVTFLLAGHETTALGLTFALFELGRRPDLKARLFAETDATPADAGHEAFPFATAVFEESLRLYPPAFALSRENVHDVVLAGVPMAKGTLVVAPPWTLHRDPRWFADPMVFRPERWCAPEPEAPPLGAYLPFGLGPRKCIGSRFAMLEAVLLLTGIARSHDWTSLDEALPPLQPAITCRPKGPVRLAVRARQPLT